MYRMVETEDSLNSLKKLQRRSSATSMLFGQHLDSSSPPPLMMENEQKTQSQPQNTRNRPANLNVHLPINNHLPPLSPSLTPTGVLLPMNTPTSFSESGAPSPAFTFTHTSFPNDENSYLSISMQIEAKWLPLCSYQHPYFRIVRPGKHLREGHHYEVGTQSLTLDSFLSIRMISKDFSSFTHISPNFYLLTCTYVLLIENRLQTVFQAVVLFTSLRCQALVSVRRPVGILSTSKYTI